MRFPFRKPKNPPIEFDAWVYLDAGLPPKIEEVQYRMIESNPYLKGREPLSRWECRFKTDIRLSIGLAPRDANPHVFRPDLLRDNVPVTSENLSGLAQAQQMIRIQFRSTIPVEGQDHLQYLWHMTLAYADLGGSSVIFDAVAERLWSVEELRSAVRESSDCRGWEMNARAVWEEEGSGAIIRTCGLPKLGHREWKTDVVERDMKVLVTEAIELGLDQVFRDPELLANESLLLEAHGVPIRLLFEDRRGSNSRHVRVFRS